MLNFSSPCDVGPLTPLVFPLPNKGSSNCSSYLWHWNTSAKKVGGAGTSDAAGIAFPTLPLPTEVLELSGHRNEVCLVAFNNSSNAVTSASKASPGLSIFALQDLPCAALLALFVFPDPYAQSLVMLMLVKLLDPNIRLGSSVEPAPMQDGNVLVWRQSKLRQGKPVRFEMWMCLKCEIDQAGGRNNRARRRAVVPQVNQVQKSKDNGSLLACV